MSNLAIFNFESEPVRAITIDGEPWFVGKDICRVLEISDHKQALGRMPDDEVMLQLLPGRREGSGLGGYNTSTQGDVEGVDVPPEPKMSQFDAGDRKVKIISEPGFCRLVFTSRTEKAERVKRWVFHEVLPALRKTGQYTDDAPIGGLAAARLRALPSDLHLRFLRAGFDGSTLRRSNPTGRGPRISRLPFASSSPV